MFKETDKGKTHYCPMCEEWAEKCDKLEKKIDEMRSQIYDLIEENEELRNK